MLEEITKPGQRAPTEKSKLIQQEQIPGKPVATTESASGLMMKQLKIGLLMLFQLCKQQFRLGRRCRQ